MTTSEVVWTDDPADPCVYCVQWVQLDDDDPDSAVPLVRPGMVAERLYRWPHAECGRSVAEYIATTERGV